ncbi:hypothetical protein F941_00655 [Acinetobacter bouvetii DSM 14964 = CIP 107468]|jgi:hypothetical protein|uniref:DUF6868 domain-containing protein n=1 Tax=Acinetobacter bouvetii DSM 14964 = CIP 107468 TaxID=1120925 RepID=N9DTL5_9GAMM|nr:hypothetical protein [Acinetobacter bouvetii]ENV83823.1 hypothetical protein F941_00655 [Acinetobacter bouvetii DSM 14964 = CIP 107468]QXW25442.1 hypothetical protein KXJ74_14205 [Acinetobacter johnsonii]BCU65697.1 hypothetical protein ACBO_24880 [Acinetobacter bouvetii]
MNITQLCDFLLYCMLFNYIILMIWFIAFIFAKDWMKQVHGQWFELSDRQFDAIHYGGMAVYKIGILLLNLAPYIALKWMQ